MRSLSAFALACLTVVVIAQSTAPAPTNSDGPVPTQLPNAEAVRPVSSFPTFPRLQQARVIQTTATPSAYTLPAPQPTLAGGSFATEMP